MRPRCPQSHCSTSRHYRSVAEPYFYKRVKFISDDAKRMRLLVLTLLERNNLALHIKDITIRPGKKHGIDKMISEFGDNDKADCQSPAKPRLDPQEEKEKKQVISTFNWAWATKVAVLMHDSREDSQPLQNLESISLRGKRVDGHKVHWVPLPLAATSVFVSKYFVDHDEFPRADTRGLPAEEIHPKESECLLHNMIYFESLEFLKLRKVGHVTDWYEVPWPLMIELWIKMLPSPQELEMQIYWDDLQEDFAIYDAP
ncbi:hypothetical protein EK21DRAFT_88212 [Setomelanomma holmii]|uniref:Uncharacterized protein n=1 Tax=Setomelanomma holmii TaxID=210430 RepID=A0A9P4LPW9_9PLEO|nr:hypothetical protein EK21DRAFT_88212 [Setomelanomma holmii]